MLIVAVETWLTHIPFSIGAAPVAFGGVTWQALDTFWVRIVTDQGLEGWGEGFGHASSPVTRAAFDTHVTPAILGEDARDIAGLRQRLSRRLHLFGTNGPHTHALSALDIALWDIAGKAAGLPIWRLLGATPVNDVTAYASLLRYADPALVSVACERTLSLGYRDVKLHEIGVEQVRAARAAIGPDAQLMVDVNCQWPTGEATAVARAFRDSDLAWFEEPVWPPEDYAGMARVRRDGGVAIAAGENTAGLHGFQGLFGAGAIDVAQPSVAKIGGISASLEVAALARAWGVRVVPHCAYFGAGHLASLHLAAALAPDQPFERLFIDMDASPYHELVLAEGGRMRVPDGPGLGRDPDLEVMRRYRTSAPTVVRL